MATIMTDLTSNGKPIELRLSPPKSFMGKRGEVDEFIQEVCLYIDINEGIYDTNKKKIGYVLSFMNKRNAKSWKGQFLQNAQTTTGLDLGTWTNFLRDFTKAFQPYDAPGNALEELTSIKMGNNLGLVNGRSRFKSMNPTMLRRDRHFN